MKNNTKCSLLCLLLEPAWPSRRSFLYSHNKMYLNHALYTKTSTLYRMNIWMEYFPSDKKVIKLLSYETIYVEWKSNDVNLFACSVIIAAQDFPTKSTWNRSLLKRDTLWLELIFQYYILYDMTTSLWDSLDLTLYKCWLFEILSDSRLIYYPWKLVTFMIILCQVCPITYHNLMPLFFPPFSLVL